MQIQFDIFSIGMGVVIQMIHPPGVEGAGPPDDAVNFITFREQQLGQVRTILPGDASNQRFFHHDPPVVDTPELYHTQKSGRVRESPARRADLGDL